MIREPRWEDLQFLTAQLARAPLLDDAEVGTELVIGPRARKPLQLDIPILVLGPSSGAQVYELDTNLERWDPAQVEGCGAFHFRVGQGDGDSPVRFPDWTRPVDFWKVANKVREITGGIPVGFQLSAQHVEDDIDFALDAGADYLILDGRAGGTDAAAALLRDHTSIPILAALPRARRHLEWRGRHDMTLLARGGLRTGADFARALALGADGVATGATALRDQPDGDDAAEQLTHVLGESVSLMKVLARACGHEHLRDFEHRDLTTSDREVAHLTGVQYSGFTPL